MYDGLMFEATTHSRAGTKQTSEINVPSAATVLLHANTVQCLMCPGCGTACKLPHGTVSNSWKWNTAVIVLPIQRCPACYCRRSAACCIPKLDTLILQALQLEVHSLCACLLLHFRDIPKALPRELHSSGLLSSKQW
jgi:hypothetical protein